MRKMSNGYAVEDKYNMTVEQLSDVVGHPVSVNKNSFRKMCDDGNVQELVSVTELPSGSADLVRVDFTESDTEEFLAECRYLDFHTASISLIRWLEVAQNVRGNSIGRMLRREMINDIGEDQTIYSNIIASKLYSVAIDQGFNRIRHGDLEGWFIREAHR